MLIVGFMDHTLEQRIPVITIGPKEVWDFTDSERQKIDRELLIEIAETAIRLAEQNGADPDELETLSMLLESAR